VIAFASGCSSVYGPASRAYKFEEGKNEGLVIISFEQPGAPYSFMYRATHTNNIRNSLAVENKRLGAYPWNVFDEISCGSGKIFYDNKCISAVRMPEGDYEFYSWLEDRSGCGPTFIVFSRLEFSVPFKVIPGKAVYVGQLDRIELDRNKYMLKVSDDREEDLPTFKKVYRNIRDDEIEVRLMEYKPFNLLKTGPK
jgi:hypothetical protein